MDKYICICCGTKKPTPRIGQCHACVTADKQKANWSRYMTKLDEMGYDFIQVLPSAYMVGNHCKVEVKNRDCGHVFAAKMNNIFSKKSICGVCGPKKRMAHALTHYIEQFGRTYDINEWNDYRDVVRGLSNENYNLNIEKLNPNGLRRGRPDLDPECGQLDHIVAIITGFKCKIPPEVMADIKNLRVIPAVENLSKKQKLTAEAKLLLDEMLAAM